MGMPSTLEDLEVCGQLVAQASLWQHALDSLFKNSLRYSLHQALSSLQTPQTVIQDVPENICWPSSVSLC